MDRLSPWVNICSVILPTGIRPESEAAQKIAEEIISELQAQWVSLTQIEGKE